MSGRIIPTVLEKGRRFPGIGPAPTFWRFMVCLRTVMASRVCHLATDILQGQVFLVAQW